MIRLFFVLTEQIFYSLERYATIESFIYSPYNKWKPIRQIS